MSPFYLMPLGVGTLWLLHASLRLLGRKEAKYTAWLLLAGLPILAIVFFLTGMATEEPDPSGSPSGLAGGGMVEAIFFVECLVLWGLAGFVETILALISASRPDKTTTYKAGAPTVNEVAEGIIRRVQLPTA